MRIEAIVCKVLGLILIVLFSVFKPVESVARESEKPAGKNHASVGMANSSTGNFKLDYAWQPQFDARPDWVDYDGIEQLSYAMGILLYSTLEEVNLSIEHIAQGMESQRRLKRKLGTSLISLSQAQAIVREHEKHQKASADRFIKLWNEKYSEAVSLEKKEKKKEGLSYRLVTKNTCDLEESTGKITDTTRFQYLLADGWNYSYPVEISGADKGSFQSDLESIFCNVDRPIAQQWKVSEFESSGELIQGLRAFSEAEGITHNNVYDVVIPSSKAYGDKGLAGVVMPHSVVRLLIRPYSPNASN